MNKAYVLLASIAAISLTAPAFAADKEKYESKTKIEADKDGGYSEKTTTKGTDAAGTDTSTKHTVDVDVNHDGSVDKTVKTVETTDPKGLGNKVKVTTINKENANGVMEHKKTVNGKTVEETTTKQ